MVAKVREEAPQRKGKAEILLGADSKEAIVESFAETTGPCTQTHGPP